MIAASFDGIQATLAWLGVCATSVGMALVTALWGCV